MTHVGFIVLVALVSLATYLTRFPPLVLARRMKVTPRLKQGLDYIPLGVFAAMVGPSVYAHVHGSSFDIAFAVAAGLAFITAFLTKNPLWTMIIGVAAAAGIRLL